MEGGRNCQGLASWGNVIFPMLELEKGTTQLCPAPAPTLSPVLRCVVNPKRLPGEGFKKNKLTAFADKIAKRIGQSSGAGIRGGDQGQDSLRGQPVLPLLGLLLGPLWKHELCRMPVPPGHLVPQRHPRAHSFLSSPTQPFFQALPPPSHRPSFQHLGVRRWYCDVLGTFGPGSCSSTG